MFYVQFTLFLSITVFEIIKQKGCYGYVFELPYATINHCVQNRISAEGSLLTSG
jgi:hypothetical protein